MASGWRHAADERAAIVAVPLSWSVAAAGRALDQSRVSSATAFFALVIVDQRRSRA
jgi:hypothetical protein